jgi:hypothetical protein
MREVGENPPPGWAFLHSEYELISRLKGRRNRCPNKINTPYVPCRRRKERL